MKNLLFMTLFTFCSVALGQEDKPAFIFTPEKPITGGSIDLVYDETSPSAALKGVSDITCYVLFDRINETPSLAEIQLKNESGIWRGKVNIVDTAACAVYFRCVSGEKQDDNNGNASYAMIYRKDNKPAREAHFSVGSYLSSGRFFYNRHKVDREQAKFHYEQEKLLYPETYLATMNLWDLRLKEDRSPEAETAVKNELTSFYASHQDNQEAVLNAIAWWEQLGDTAKADEIRKKEIGKNPKGEIAQSVRSAVIWKETDNKKRIDLLKQFFTDFPSMDKKTRQAYLPNLFMLQVRNDQLAEAADVLSEIEKPEIYHYNEIAYKYIEKGENLEKAVGWAKKGVDKAKNPDLSDKPSYMATKDWTENNKYYTSMILDTYGYGLSKLGKHGEAESVLGEVYAESKGDDPEINLHYIQALEKSGKFDKALEIGTEAITRGKDSPEITENLKSAFAGKSGKKGSYENLGKDQKSQFEKMISDATAKKIEVIRKSLKESRLNSASTDFTLKDMNGMPVTLTALKGKVVILDFWATWCGPCKSSFPYLQKVYEKYQTNEKVKILTINSWERQKDYPAQLENAKSFMSTNKYTFPVLIDEKEEDQFIVIGNYGVEGIPTKFILDKNGNIAWKVVGFDNGQFMIDEMTEQIEMLLGE